MRLEEVNLTRRFLDLFRKDGIEELYPPQEMLVKSGAFSGTGNIVLCTPTASGKTFASELAIAKALEAGKKAVYVVPLRSLAYEKHGEFRKYETLGYKLRLEMGDLDSKKYKRKADFDVLVTTAEKCDSILRSSPEWFRDIGILVMDEVHLINSDRGPVYEIIISKFRRIFPDIRVLALSATIGNATELADWLSAELLSSQWRPVKLYEEAVVADDSLEKIEEIISDSIRGGGQALVFVNSRRSAESVAEKIGSDLSLAGANAPELEAISDGILSALSSPTQQCRRLSGCVRNGTGFHHAGLVNDQRNAVEDAFRRGALKVIVATPTLAAGVNLPARTVVVRDMTRFEGGAVCYIPVMEYKQQAGRAGRPRFDKIGYSYVIARSEDDKDFFTERYINGEIEDITSKLGVEPVLRFHVLASVASDFTKTREALLDFFRSTFFGHQYGLSGFEAIIERILSDLGEWGFVEEKGRFLVPTAVGRRVSELYIDPKTAHTYITFLSGAEEKKRFPVIGLLEVLCDSAEMPLLNLKRSEETPLWESAYLREGDFLRDIGGFDLDAYFLERYKTALLMDSWINELSEEQILETYGVAPGILNQRLQIAEWLAYSAAELSRALGYKSAEKEMKKLETRIGSGIKEELIALVSIKGVGRVRARKLWNAGLKSPKDLKDAPKEKLAALIGEKTAEKVRSSL